MVDVHERGLPVKRLLVVVVAAALAWSAFWFWQAHAQRQAIHAWAADLAQDGTTVTWDDLAIRGFPNRIDSTFAGLRGADARGAIEMPRLQVLQMVWNPRHVILALPDGATLRRQDKDYRIDGDGIRASAVRDDGGWQRLNVEAEVLNLSGELTAALSGVTGAITRGATPPTLRMALNAVDVALPDSLGSGGLRMDLTAGLDRVAADSLEDLRSLRLDRFEIEQGALNLAATGDVDVDTDGALDGAVTLRAANLPEALKAERRAGRIPPGVLTVIEQGSQLLSGLSGRSDSIDLTFEFRGGRTWVGILPIGPAPRLR